MGGTLFQLVRTKYLTTVTQHFCLNLKDLCGQTLFDVKMPASPVRPDIIVHANSCWVTQNSLLPHYLWLTLKFLASQELILTL